MQAKTSAPWVSVRYLGRICITSDPPLIEECTGPALGIGEFAVDGRPRYAQHDLTGAHQGDLGREEGIFAHERLGAVDGIDQPQILRVRIAGAGLLAVESVRWKTRFE